jgi:signal transduction histidine kinase
MARPRSRDARRQPAPAALCKTLRCRQAPEIEPLHIRRQALVGAHALLLANASHELRTPLSRLDLGIELYGNAPNAKSPFRIRSCRAKLMLAPARQK